MTAGYDDKSEINRNKLTVMILGGVRIVRGVMGRAEQETEV